MTRDTADHCHLCSDIPFLTFDVDAPNKPAPFCSRCDRAIPVRYVRAPPQTPRRAEAA